MTATLFGSYATRPELGAEAEAYVTRASTMLQRVSAVLKTDRVISLELLKSRRERLGTMLMSYQRFKHSMIFDPVIACGPSSSKVIARSMKVDCILLGHVFSAYIERWRGLVKQDLPVYKADMIDMSDMMLDSLSNELRAIRQLISVADLYS